MKDSSFFQTRRRVRRSRRGTRRELRPENRKARPAVRSSLPPPGGGFTNGAGDGNPSSPVASRLLRRPATRPSSAIQGGGRVGFDSPHPYWRGESPQTVGFSNGAGDGNRTHVCSLEGCRSTIELHPRKVVSNLPLLGQFFNATHCTFFYPKNGS